MEPCAQDFDCADNELCYTNTSYFSTLLSQNSGLRRPGCECNAWYAWEGVLCNEFSFGTFFFFAFAFLLATANFVAGVVACVSFKKNLGRLKRCVDADSRVTSSLYTALASAGLFCWTIILALSHFITSGPFLGGEALLESDPYKNRYNFIGFIGGSIGTLFVGLASIQICFIWLEIAKQFRASTHFTVKQLSQYRWVLFLFFVLGVVVVVLAQVLQRKRRESPNVLGFVMAPLVLLLAVTFALAGRKISLLLEEMGGPSLRVTKGPEEEEERETPQVLTHYTASNEQIPLLEHAIRSIRLTCRLAVVCFSTFLLSFLTFSIIDLKGNREYGGLGWRNSVNPGSSFPLAKIIYYLGVAACSCMNVNLARYIFLEHTNRKQGAILRSRRVRANRASIGVS